MKSLKKFKNLQGYTIAANMAHELNRTRQKSDIHSYMALAELLGLVDKETARYILELGTDNGLRAIRSQGNTESHRREEITMLREVPEHMKDENQDWSDVM
jgi:DNA integrity scanning protein DisA with diadenylate cyclase activity